MPDDPTRWVPISEYSQTLWNWPTDEYMRSCEIHGEKAWTDGFILCLGEPPAQDEPLKPISLERVEPHFSREVYEVNAVAVAQFGKASVIFESGHLIQAKYFNLFREKWPDSKFFGCDKSKRQDIGESVPPILVRSGEKLVGAVMTIRTADLQDRIKCILQMTKKVEANAT